MFEGMNIIEFGKKFQTNADIILTKKIVEAGKFLDLPIKDHLIICNEEYYSFADQGIP